MEKPYFELSKKKVFENVNFLKKYCDEISYSWKTNKEVGEILNKEDKYFTSVHSINELMQVPNKNKIWFFLFGNSKEEYERLFNEFKLENFVVDNLEDLNNLINYIKKHNHKINLLLRTRLYENTLAHGKNYYFGMKLEIVKKKILELSSSSNIKDIGIHTHRKTQNVSEWDIKDEIVENLGEEVLSKISFFNLGGGFPADYKNSHDKSKMKIFKLILELKKILNKYNIKLILEPGRFIAASPIKLISHIKLIVENTCFLDISIFNGCLDTVVANVKLKVEGELEKGTRYLLKGITPDSCDILRYAVYLDNPKKKDKIVFLNAGAYNYTSNFCALEKIETKII
jgi:ornithine decarboxylase